MENEWMTFLRTNEDYSTEGALSILLKHNEISYFLQVAHVRKTMDKALEDLVHQNLVHLSQRDFYFLRVN